VHCVAHASAVAAGHEQTASPERLVGGIDEARHPLQASRIFHEGLQGLGGRLEGGPDDGFMHATCFLDGGHFGLMPHARQAASEWIRRTK